MKRRATTARTTYQAYRKRRSNPGAARSRIEGSERRSAPARGSPDLCSKRWIWEQYDYTVRTNTIVGPGSDAAVVRVKETDTSIAMSLDGNGRYCYLDPREGAKLAVAECCRNLATTGAVPVAATNNLNFGNPERPKSWRSWSKPSKASPKPAHSSKRPSPAATSASITKRWAKAFTRRRSSALSA
jgi:phosphoribosylformylglycinamidine (FGAM) synthase-like enzyme